MPTEENKEVEFYTADKLGEFTHRIQKVGETLEEFAEACTEAMICIKDGIEKAYTISLSVTNKELYDFQRMLMCKPPLKKGNNRWRTIRKLERRR